MDMLLRTIKFRNAMKVIDLTRSQLVATRLEQAKVTCLPAEKEALLYLLLRSHPGRTIIFCNAITCLQRMRSLLALLQVDVMALQGNMQQRARLKALDRFRERRDSVLIATDVAARCLDIPGVDYVIHFQLPRSAETYVHRSGRTARGDRAGLSVALLDPSEQKTYKKRETRREPNMCPAADVPSTPPSTSPTRPHPVVCLELDLKEGLPDLPLETKLLSRVTAAVSMAKQALPLP